MFLGVFFLGERLRPAQWTAVGLSFVAVVVLTVGYGAVPWISLILAFSFGFYGYIKKRVGGQVDAVSGLTLETAWLVPIAVVELIVVNAMSGLVFGTAGVGNTLILLSAGVVTAIPLLLFATAASRLPLSIVGFLQYFAPILQFIIGITVVGEAMPPERLDRLRHRLARAHRAVGRCHPRGPIATPGRRDALGAASRARHHPQYCPTYSKILPFSVDDAAATMAAVVPSGNVTVSGIRVPTLSSATA